MDRRTIQANAPPPNILDRPLTKTQGQQGLANAPFVSLSAFSFLFSEIVQYSQNRVNSISDLERKLESAGNGIGIRITELITCRERLTKREVSSTDIYVLMKYYNIIHDNSDFSDSFGQYAAIYL